MWPCPFSTFELQKWPEHLMFLTFWLANCASRHSGVPFFDICPPLRCFVHFDLQICFSPQRRTIFRHLNFEKWFEHAVFCTFWLENVLGATASCNFSVLCWTATSAPAAALASLLFRPSGTTNHWKTTAISNFPYILRVCVSSFFWLSHTRNFFLLILLLCSAFQLSILSEVRLLNFLRR